MIRHFASALLFLIASATLPPSAKAQGVARALEAVPVNSVVRLRGPEIPSRRITGRLGPITRDTVYVRSGQEMVPVPIAHVTEAHVATDRNHTRGILKGAQAGGMVGGVLGALSINAACDNCDGLDRLGATAVGFTVGAAYFVIPGAVVGFVIGTQEWQPVHPAGSRVQLAPAAEGGLSIGLSFSTH